MPLGTQVYDHVLSGNAMHHVLHDTKRELYKRIHAALKPGGKYIEGDTVIPCEMEGQFIAEYHEAPPPCRPPRMGPITWTFPFRSRRRKPCCWRPGSGTFD